MAREVGFVERNSPIGGFNFLLTFTNGLLNTPEGTLGQLTAFMANACGADISPQALDGRINDLGREFLKQCLERALELSSRPLDLDSKLVGFLDHIFIIDSTNFDLHASLKEVFKGCKGSASESSMRIQFVYDYLTGKTYVEIGDVNLSDAETLNDIVSLDKLDADGNCLFLSDLGYFKTDTFLKIDLNKGLFFLSRLKYKVKIYDSDGSEIDLIKILKKKPEQIDMIIKIGELECRLVGKRLPEEIINKRMRKVNKENKKKGRSVTNEYKLFLSYGFFITNLPEKFNFDLLYTVYRLRWQIELLFKTWKSILKIHYIRAAKEPRVLCQVYGKLIIATLSGIIYWNAQLHSGYNLSTHKVLQHLKTVAIIWAIHIFNGEKEHQDFLEEMIRQVNRTCRKNNQKNKPTIEFLLENLEFETISFEAGFSKNTA